MQNIFKIFSLITLVSAILLTIVIYNDKKFKNNPLSDEVKTKLYIKNEQIKQKIKEVYNIDFKVPLIISDDLHNNLFGLATYKKGQISIILNKKRFQENENYMIDSVLPHEYAHALMFHFGDFTKINGGHTKRWQEFCLNIGGNKCDRFVGHNDILIEKLGGIY